MPISELFTSETFLETVPEWLRSAFTRLPKDQYLAEGYRFRRLSRFHVRDGELRQLPHAPYTQNTERGLNTLMGEIERTFEEIEEGIVQSSAFRHLIARFLRTIGAGRSALFLNIHFIRNICTTTQPGYPAPEGIHRDGFDIVGILAIAEEDAVGALTELYLPFEQFPVYQAKLLPGQLLLLDDTKLLHYTSPIEIDGVAHPGFRDVIIFTADFIKNME